MREEAILRENWCWPPLPGRLPNSATVDVERRIRAEIERRHREAVEKRQSNYLDPVSSLSVFTASFLADRRYCCDSGCRHCPYESPSA